MYFTKIDKYYWRSDVNYHLSINYIGDNQSVYMLYDNNKNIIDKCETFENALQLANTHFLLNN